MSGDVGADVAARIADDFVTDWGTEIGRDDAMGIEDWLRTALAPLIAARVDAAKAEAFEAVIERADSGIEFGPDNFRRLCRIVRDARTAALNPEADQ